MNVQDLAVVFKNDTTFKSNVRFATLIATAVAAYGGYYSLHYRVSKLESRVDGKVEVSLERAPELDLPKPKSAKVSSKSRTNKLYNNHTMIRMERSELECLARNIYHEARFEPYIGQIAVAQVTFNRVLDGKWGDSFCKVVYAHKQFSWTLKSRLRNMQPKDQKWKEAMHNARMFQYGVRVNTLENVKHYHANYVSPKWKHDYTHVDTLGQHLFYASN